MASHLFEIGLTNAALAIVLSLVVVLITRWKSNAHLASILWLIILFKFVTPPLLPLAVTVKPNESAVSSVDLREPTPAKVDPKPHPDSWAAVPVSPRKPATQPAVSENSMTNPAPRVQTESTLSTATMPITDASGSFSAWNEVRELWNLQTLWLVWLFGSFVATTLFLINGIRFNRIVRLNSIHHASHPIGHLLQNLCEELGVRRLPKLAVVEAEISPLVWTWMGRTSVVVPARLARELAGEQLEMILCHELAHIRRRDHWFRWLEAAVQCLYWWFLPLVWIRRQLHAAQEECCDAFVDNCYPERRVEYCETLFNAAVQLTNARRAPLVASEFGRAPGLKARIQVLLQARLSKPLSKPVLAGCLLCGALVAALSVRWVTAEDKKEADKDKPTTVIRVTGGDGSPIIQGQVEINGKTDKGEYFQQQSGIRRGKANFYLDSNRAQELTVQISAPSHLTHYKKFVPKNAEESFAVEPEYQFDLKSGIKIGGQVLDETGKPLEGAELHIYFANSIPIEEGFDSVEAKPTTNTEGKWELDGVRDDLSKMILSVRHPSYVSSKEVDFVRPEDHAKLKQLADVRKLAAAPKLTGKVVDPDGKPVAGAMILFSEENLYQAYGRGTIPITDGKGEFLVPKVSPGIAAFTVFSPNWALHGVKVPIPQTAPLTVTLRKGKRVEFHTVDAKGQPIEGIAFYPQFPQVAEIPPGQETVFLSALDFLTHRDFLNNKTDERGLFIWENAPDMTLGYQIISKDYLSQPGGEYGPEGSPHKLAFRRTIPVEANVVDAETGKSLESYTVVEGTHFKANTPGMWSWYSDNDNQNLSGKYQGMLHALDRIIRFRVQAKGYRPMVSKELDAAALPDSPVSLEFRMAKDDKYAIQVLQPDGQPASGAILFFSVSKNPRESQPLRISNGQSADSKAAITGITGNDGRKDILPLGGPFVCYISHKSGFKQLSDAELFADETIRLDRWAKVEGQLFIQGAPAPNIAVSLDGRNFAGLNNEFPAIELSHGTRTDADGKFAFPQVTADRWTRIVTYDERSVDWNRACRQQETFTLSSGETRSENIGTQGADVVGRAKWPNDPKIEFEGNYVNGSELIDPPPKDSRDRIKSQYLLRLPKDGSFRCFNFAPGRHEITISIRIKAEDFPRPGYTKTIVLTPEMFAGKSPTNPIDLGEIELEAVK